MKIDRDDLLSTSIAIDRNRETSRYVATAKCNCGRSEPWSASGSNGGLLPTNIIEKHFITRGWKLQKHNAVCPHCIAKEGDARRYAKKEKERELVLSRQIRRNIFRALDRMFDENTNRFSLDIAVVEKQVSESLSVPIQWVTNMRRENFF